MRTWAGSCKDGFDVGAADLLVRQTAGAVPAPVSLVLDLAADGVKLTPRGGLPRAFVRQVQERCPDWGFSDHPASVEEDLSPLASLHEILRQGGLLRLHKGVVSPTRAAADDIETVRRLRSWFGPDDSFTSVLAGEALGSLVAHGPCRPEVLADRLRPLLGDRWVTGDGEPLDQGGIRSRLYHVQSVLVGLDLVATDKGTWTAGPSARWLLPRATALAHLWST